ncbi:DUF924 family protein [Sandaracinobacter sp. RS1-74]|uniref:DUF924 family protein n=1 Tax=Sandaracinobacteroides sayramensis TaxID=2913411 RepID=UPI001EDBB7AD|nr:DUF924 family protein [Sandaracinobacteroides sayramensis]MCG2841737.1 DUF924 family protein [Sandaracinobacteroides sayramensis]
MTEPTDVTNFWRDAGAEAWFRKDDAFDADFRARFLEAHEAAARGDLDGWAESADGALALMILLDQFPRNAFRGSARMFETDAKALQIAEAAIAAGQDQQVAPDLRLFFYLPYEHSEALADQEKAVELIRPLGPELLHYAEVHREAIARFGRFPHRNELLGRETTAEEQAFLDSGGFAG